MKRRRKGVFPSRRIASVAAGRQGRVTVTWEDGGVSRIDLRPWMAGVELVKLLDEVYFAGVAVGEFGWTLAWGGGEIEIDSVHLQMLEAEGRGLVCSPEAMRRWRKRFGLTLEGAARALGVSRRSIAYYEAGGRPIPKAVALACKGYGDMAEDSAALEKA